MEKVTCPHGCKVLLKKDKKTGALKCPKCKCVFRVVVCRWDPKCYAEHYPEKGQYKKEKSKKRGRPKGKKKRK